MTSATPPEPTSAIGTSLALVERAAAALVRALSAAARSVTLHDQARTLRTELREPRRAVGDARDGTGALDGDGLPALREHLRGGVRHYAVALREAGEPPERMLRLMKEAVGPALRLGPRDDRVRRISDDIVRWSLDAYYAA